MKRGAARAHPLETGGVLVGVLTDGGRPWVVGALELPSRTATGTSYAVARDARPAAVDQARSHDARLGYVGDWHSHPADVGPSTTDAATMRRLAADPDAGCSHPVLIVVRRCGDHYRLDARQVAVRRLRRLEVVMAGRLGEERSVTATTT